MPRFGFVHRGPRLQILRQVSPFSGDSCGLATVIGRPTAGGGRCPHRSRGHILSAIGRGIKPSGPHFLTAATGDRLAGRYATSSTASRNCENLGVSFVSLRDSIDLSSPSGVLMFQLIAAMSQFERRLIQERVRAGLQNAKRKGKRLGRRPVEVDLSEVASLRHSGASWRMISKELGISVGKVHKAFQQRS